ncbi:MAG: gfo/Idh/MocA family oxidoreductase, partial [Gemmatimonadota bacterium]|nr:gfo/Idh/MocA family oxidoreductase [Gemmatimonadota bacterium]
MATGNNINRRKFIGSAAATAALTVVPRSVLGGPDHIAPSDKIKIGYIGMGTQGLRELPRLLRDERVVVTSVCDPNRDSNDYVDWSRHGLRNGIRRFLDDQSWGA